MAPLTPKWVRTRRFNARDGADEFRGELEGVQEQVRAFATELNAMAYGPLKSLARPCTRICARTKTFLLDSREREVNSEKSRFPLVNLSFFETKRIALKSMILES